MTIIKCDNDEDDNYDDYGDDEDVYDDGGDNEEKDYWSNDDKDNRDR